MALDEKKIEELIAAARAAQQRSHSPYSRFAVGAALLMDDGRVVTGCNVENASYGLTICAERTAMVRAVAEGAGRPVAVAVAGPTEEALLPCGACRQFLAEFNDALEVICVGTGEDRFLATMRELLPGAINGEQIAKGRREG